MSSTSPDAANGANGASPDFGFPDKLVGMFKIGFVVDCKFIVGPTKTAETIFGHKWMFAVESIVFERMFCGDFMEAKNSTEIRLPEDDPSAFRNLRRILYNPRSFAMDSISFDETISLYILCDKYMVKSISKLCSDYLKTFTNISNSKLIKLFSLASEFQDKPLLKNIQEKLQSLKYPLTTALYDLNEEQFLKYIQLYVRNNASINHLALFEQIEQYLLKYELTIPENDAKTEESKQDPTENKAMEFKKTKKINPELFDLLTFIDFGKMNVAEFLAGPGASKILTLDQKYFILSHLSTKPCINCYGSTTLILELYNPEH